MKNPVLKHIEDQYEILDKLGEGGMGVVYKVRHRLLEELRVVKVMRRALAADEELGARFLREARIAVRLKHPHIAQLYDFALDEDGTAYIVMEFLEGVTLREFMDRTGPPPLASALEIARQSLAALGYLHHRGFVHRDVSPDNLMITTDVDGHSLVKLIDLGLAKGLAGGTAFEQMTVPGMFMGKLRYSSPEQFGPQGAAGVDARSDLYSFGIVLYELLTGTFPIAGHSPPTIMAGHLKDPPLDFCRSDPHGRVPEALRGIVLKALAKQPDKRFADAEEFSDALSRVHPPPAMAQEDLGGDSLTGTLVLPARVKQDSGPEPISEDLPTMALPRAAPPSRPAKPPRRLEVAAGRPGRRQRLQGPRVADKTLAPGEIPGDVTVRLPKAAKTAAGQKPTAAPARPVTRRQAEERKTEITAAAAEVDRVPREPLADRPLRAAVSPPPSWDHAVMRPESAEGLPRTFAVVKPTEKAPPTGRRSLLGIIAAAGVALTALAATWIWWPQPSPVVEDDEVVALGRPKKPAADAEELTRALKTGDVASLRVASTRLRQRGEAEPESLRRAQRILDLFDRMWSAERDKRYDEVLRLAAELTGLYPAFSEPAEEYRRRAVAALAGTGASEEAPAREAEELRSEALVEETRNEAEELAAATPAGPGVAIREPESVPPVEPIGSASEELAGDPDRIPAPGDLEPAQESADHARGTNAATPRGDPRMERILEEAARAEANQRPGEGLIILSGVNPTAPYEARFRAARQRLEKLLAELDQGNPVVVVRQGHPLEYAPNQTGQIELEIRDDYGLEEVRIWLRVEGATAYREFPLKSNSGFQTVNIPVDLHQNKTVEFYVRAVDHSGHLGSLGSAQQPLQFKKKS